MTDSGLAAARGRPRAVAATSIACRRRNRAPSAACGRSRRKCGRCSGRRQLDLAGAGGSRLDCGMRRSVSWRREWRRSAGTGSFLSRADSPGRRTKRSRGHRIRALDSTFLANFNDEHRPLVLAEAAETARFHRPGNRRIARVVASHGLGGERQRLPGVTDIVQAVSIGAVAILPRLAPRDAGQDKYDRRIAARDSEIARSRAARPCATTDGSDTARRASPSGRA